MVTMKMVWQKCKDVSRQRMEDIKSEMISMDYFYYILWQIVLFFFVYLTLLSFFPNESLPPNGPIFHMYCLFILAHIFAKITYLTKLPTLLGMLIAGFIYGNVLEPEMDKSLMGYIRSIALMVILLRAGLHLVPEYIRKLSLACARITVIPFIAETLTVAVCSQLFFQFNFVWSLMIGLVLAAVSPAVIVPCMIRIQEAGLSAGKGLPTLNIAAASIDDVLAVTGFNICKSFAFGDGENENGDGETSLAFKIAKGPIEIIIGIVFGVMVGVLLWYIPERYDTASSCSISEDPISDETIPDDTNQYHISRFSLMFMAAMFAMFGSVYFDMEASGPLAILILAFVAKLRWRQNGWDEDNEHSLKIVWLVFKRFLFCLIGSQLLIKHMDPTVVMKASVMIIIGILIKVIVAYLVTYGIGLNHKERLFVAISWIPKATVQAAIGPTAFALAKNDEDKLHGRIILSSAAISILMTAPLGAILIDYLCLKLLTKPEDEINNNYDPDKLKTHNIRSKSIKNISLSIDKLDELTRRCKSLDRMHKYQYRPRKSLQALDLDL